MKRATAATLMIVILLCSAVLPVCSAALPAQAVGEGAGEFKISDWAVESYSKANTYGISNWFHRNDDYTVPITRAEFCDMMFNVIKALDNGVAAEIDICADAAFTDTDRYSIYCLAQLGIAKGVSDEKFNPDGSLTREQAAVFMYRAGQILDFTYLPPDPAEFTDIPSIASWALAAVNVMQESGVMTGTGVDDFLPQSLLTREQATIALVRFLEKNGYNPGLYIKDEDGDLTLADLAGLNGKYRSTGANSYEVSYYQGNFASLVLSVTGDTIQQAIFTYQNSGKSADLLSARMDDFTSDMYDLGRYHLGNNAYTVESDGKQMLELAGNVAFTLPADQYGSIRYQKMDGSYVAYAVKDGSTEFFMLENGEPLFTVRGSVYGITNKYIITETTRYPQPTVDAAYQVYGVYTLDGTLVEDLGLEHDELSRKGYITDY